MFYLTKKFNERCMFNIMNKLANNSCIEQDVLICFFSYIQLSELLLRAFFLNRFINSMIVFLLNSDDLTQFKLSIIN